MHLLKNNNNIIIIKEIGYQTHDADTAKRPCPEQSDPKGRKMMGILIKIFEQETLFDGIVGRR
jgi:hypothetical protein